jgi:Zn-dependent peptidase ImmA (M78 family)
MTLTERNLGNLRDPIVPEGGELKWPQLPLSWGFYVSPDNLHEVARRMGIARSTVYYQLNKRKILVNSLRKSSAKSLNSYM